MCGLVGVWKRDGSHADRAGITPMLAAIAHRGPDGQGVWQDGGVALGHLRLSILDLSEAADQPMLSADGMGVLVYNGEVYNYREMRQELEREGVRFRSSGDAEVVLNALHYWGPERALKRFNGMFAFAYFDRRENVLWLARDRVGIKPLLFANTGSMLVFASEVKALLAHPRVNKRVDRQAVTRWLLFRGRGPQRALFEGVEAVRPGSCLKVTEAGIEKHQYYHAANEIDIDRLLATSAQRSGKFVDQLRDHLERSVKLHLASDAPLATMCSGGLDSSLIAAHAREERPGIEAFVADVRWQNGEAAQAERVGRHLGIPVHRVLVDRVRFLELWPEAVWHSDSPPIEPSDAALLAVARACRRQGIKVLLTGEGSDELFGGYPWQRTTFDLWSEVGSTPREFFTGIALDKRISLKQILAVAPFSTMVARTDPVLRKRLIMALEGEGESLPKELLKLFRPIKSRSDRAFLTHCIYSLYNHLPWLLHRHDRMGMAASIEMRVPFLENDIMDFAFHLPRRVKLRRGVGKWAVKRSAAGMLPRNVVYAEKKGFPVPHEFARGTQHLLSGGLLADLMEWPTKTVEQVISWLGNNGELRFQVVGLELWSRIFFGGESPEALGDRLIVLANDAVPSPRKLTKQKPIPKSAWHRLWTRIR